MKQNETSESSLSNRAPLGTSAEAGGNAATTSETGSAAATQNIWLTCAHSSATRSRCAMTSDNSAHSRSHSDHNSLAEARKDTEWRDWLESQADIVHIWVDSDMVGAHPFIFNKFLGVKLRDAIDSQMIGLVERASVISEDQQRQQRQQREDAERHIEGEALKEASQSGEVAVSDAPVAPVAPIEPVAPVEPNPAIDAAMEKR